MRLKQNITNTSTRSYNEDWVCQAEKAAKELEKWHMDPTTDYPGTDGFLTPMDGFTVLCYNNKYELWFAYFDDCTAAVYVQHLGKWGHMLGQVVE
jgi:hypothetical protein